MTNKKVSKYSLYRKNKQNCFMFILILFCFLSGCGTAEDSYHRAIPNLPDPVQEPTSGETSFELDGYTVTLDYKYTYDIDALVVETHTYNDSDIAGKLVPRDIALAWGKIAEYNDRIDFHWSQSNRWYFWRTDSYEETDAVGGRNAITSQSSNNHLIAADDKIGDNIQKIKTGDHIRIQGYLVNLSANKPDGTNFWWNSSTSRTDSGDDSCELIYVTSLEWLD